MGLPVRTYIYVREPYYYNRGGNPQPNAVGHTSRSLAVSPQGQHSHHAISVQPNCMMLGWLAQQQVQLMSLQHTHIDADRLALLIQVVDSAVLRFPKAVTHFSPGSYSSRPLQTTSLPNVFMAGDWVKGVPHGANGLSQVGTIDRHAKSCVKS